MIHEVDRANCTMTDRLMRMMYALAQIRNIPIHNVTFSYILLHICNYFKNYFNKFIETFIIIFNTKSHCL